MKITFKETHQSSLDGINIIIFEQGKEYDLPVEKAHKYIDSGVATTGKTLETKVEAPEEVKTEKPKKKK